MAVTKKRAAKRATSTETTAARSYDPAEGVTAATTGEDVSRGVTAATKGEDVSRGVGR